MTAAETWLEYQESYARYGFDMKPRERQEERARRKQAVREAAERKRDLSIARAKGRLAFLAVFFGLIAAMLIVSTAYVAAVRYDINSTVKANDTLRGEIENLDVKIKSASAISTIEAKALNELGMVYPTSDQYVYLGEEKAPSDMAEIIIESVYSSRDDAAAAEEAYDEAEAREALRAAIEAESAESEIRD